MAYGTEYNFPLIVPMPLIAVDDDLIRLTVPDALLISKVQASLQALAAGTCTFQVIAGGVTTTIPVTTAKTVTESAGLTTYVGAGGLIRIGATGIGTTPLGGVVTIWCRLARD